jgi:glutamate dehydrogenase (NADP+)
VSGSGNVAQYTAEKLIHLGAKVVSLSDSSGTIYDPEGITAEKLAFVDELKNIKRGRIEEYATHYGCEYRPGKRPWDIPCDLAFPSATQNELSLDDAKALVKNGCIAVCEGANMPTTPDAVAYFINNNVLFGPGKAANAGGVAVSGLEMTQNSMRLSWDRHDLESRLNGIMTKIHDQCAQYAYYNTKTPNYVDGANIAGFIKVAQTMLSYGIH